MRTWFAFSLVLFSSLLSSNVVLAQWQLDGVPLTDVSVNMNSLKIVSDGAGGSIASWCDYRNGSDYDIFAQRTDAFGVVQWTTNGVALCTAASDQYNPTIVADGAGGAIVTWQDYRNGTDLNIYAQRINASGVVQWAANGVAVCAKVDDQEFPTTASDGTGGVIATWQDFRSEVDRDIYAQRINAAGVAQWTFNGVALCTAVQNQVTPKIASDGAGGAIVVWSDGRSGTDSDLYAQRINVSGVVQWAADGVAVCVAPLTQSVPTIVSDGAGGAIAAWQDARNVVGFDIYAQRMNASGVFQWAANGAAVCTAASAQNNPTIVSDGAGGAIVAWQDLRGGVNYDIYAQRIGASGAVKWIANGVALCTAVGAQLSPAIASDEAGGGIVSWRDSRGGGGIYQIYARRISTLGQPGWTADGAAVCTTVGDHDTPVIASTGTSGAIVAWPDYRDSVPNFYTQRVDIEEGYWGHPEPTVTLVADIPGDQGGKVKVNWKASDRDTQYDHLISHYSIWRAVDAVAMSQAQTIGAASMVDNLADVGADFKGPAYRVEQMASGTARYWEWVGNQDMLFSPGYSFSASTRNDSTIASSPVTYFQVAAHTLDAYTFWVSNEKSGRSVDNLAPAAPLSLTAQRAGSDVHLKWNRVHVADLSNYSVYRATSSGVTPVPVNFLSSANDTVLVDASAPTSSLYYIVTAHDVHQNQSPSSNEAAVSPATGVGNTPALSELTVLQNRPNPFAGATEFEIGLPSSSDISVEIYDVAGRRVRTQSLPQQRAGWQRVSFDGRDSAGRALASGVYFCRVTANGATVTRKMVIAR